MNPRSTDCDADALLVLPRHARCVLSRLRCNGHSLLLSSYLSRIGRIENPSCSVCGHSYRDTSHLILLCPAMDSLRRSLFGDSLSLYDLWSRLWGVARLLGLHGLSPYPIPRKGSGNQQQHETEITFFSNLANFGWKRIALYRRDGLSSLSSFPTTFGMFGKKTVKLFQDHKLKITTKVNLQTDFSNVTFHLRSTK